jgi:octaprenyl-diphosphate synthase
VGGDLREGKVTLPLVYALERTTPAERRLVETVLEQRDYQRVPFAQVLALVDRHDGIGRVRERAQTFTERARQVMSEFPESAYQRAMMAVTDLVTERDH